MRPDTLGVIGLGAIGGSIALDGRAAGIPHVIGCAAARADATAALRAGAITELAADWEGVVHAADFVVIATPPAAVLDLLAGIGGALRAGGPWCTDTASVKAPIVRQAAQLELAARFAGSHPFAGTHESGFAAARAGRFAGAPVYVTALPGGEEASRVIARFWESVCGAVPVEIDAERHDAWLAWSSHLPQVVSSALAVALARAAPSGATFGAGAADTTRLAAGDAAMWRDVFRLNRQAVLHALDAFDQALAELRDSLTRDDAAAVTAWLTAGAAWRRHLER